MKVNITGRGIIPGLGVIPPIYNKEMSIPAISRLLNFPNFSVFDAATGIRFTKKNIKNVAMNTQSPYTGVDVDPPKTLNKQTRVTPVVEKAPEPPVIEEAPVVESEEVTVVSEPEETPVIEETTDVVSDEEVTEETVDTTDEVEEAETVDEEPSQQQSSNTYNNYNRKKNKKRH